MPRKRLRPFLDEVIADDDLRLSAARVAGEPVEELALTVAPAEPPSSPAEAGFPPPPWEQPPTLALAPEDGAAPPANGSHTARPDTVLTVEPPPPLPVVITPAAIPAVTAAETDGATALDTPAPMSVAPPRDITLPPIPMPPLVAPSAPASDLPSVSTPPATDGDGDGDGTVLLGTPHVETTLPRRRRRRSASLLPPLPSATDVPEDAAGRVAIISVPGPQANGSAPQPAAETTAADAEPAPVTAVGGEAPLAGWLPVLLLGVALVIVFVVAVLVTR